MHLYERSHYIAGGELYLEYKPELISEVLNSLTPKKANIIVYSRMKPDDFYTETEPWFRTSYRAEGFIFSFLNYWVHFKIFTVHCFFYLDIPAEWMQVWIDCPENSEFHIPEPNPYLTTDFLLLPSKFYFIFFQKILESFYNNPS